MSDDRPRSRQSRVRLTPPPRVAPVGRRRPARSDSAGGRRGWLVALGAAAVLAALAGLYLLVPRLVDPAGRAAVVEAAGAPPEETGPAAGELSPAAADDRTATSGAPDAGRSRAAAPGASASTRVESGGTAESTSDSRSQGRAPAASRRASDSGAEFGRAMAEGLAALEAGEWPAALAAFERAETLRPDSPEPADGRARVEAARTRQLLEERRARGRELLAAEEWQAAAVEFRAAIELDPSLTFARAGLETAESRARLDDRLAYHLDHPERLGAAEVQAEVEELLEIAREVAEPGPRHRERIARLEAVAAAARMPVKVSLRSDARTEVTVYRVGNLGTFERRELELRPGTYTVVGTRSGYRDVRRQLRVEPGTPPEPLEIRCEEKI